MRKEWLAALAVLVLMSYAHIASAETKSDEAYEQDHAECMQIAQEQSEQDETTSFIVFYRECMIDRGYDQDGIEDNQISVDSVDSISTQQGE